MRNLMKVLFVVMLLSMVVFAQSDFNLVGVNSFYDDADTNAVWYGNYDSRGLCAGSDLDGDGKQEVFITNYGGTGTVIGFEAVDSAVLEMIWTGDTSATTYETGTRAVQTGDLDGDGLGEVIYFRGRYASDPNAGLYIHEADGTDNGFKAKTFWSINDLAAIFNFNGKGADGNIATIKVESFVIDDVDNDGKDELIFASNGSSYPTDYIDTVYTATDTTYDTYGHSEDMFCVLSATTGDLQQSLGGADLQLEFATSARDIDMGTADTSSADFGRENALGGGSAITVTTCDIDGDGKREIFCAAWNGFNNFFVEATGPDTYSFGDTTNHVANGAYGDGVVLMQAGAGDVDDNGKDEVYVKDYTTGYIYAITDVDGDATHLVDSTEYTILDSGNLAIGGYSSVVYDFDGNGRPEAYLGGSGDDDIMQWDGSAWNSWTTDSTAGGFISKADVGDLDGDGNYELITAHQSVVDSMEQVTGDTTVGFDTTNVVNPHIWFVRVSEFGDDELGVTDYRIVTPMDYKLDNAYPNPFNPTTTINYTLPINKEISLIVYNQLGQKITTLVDNKRQNAGTYQVLWNGTNSNGQKVASGVYFYMLKYGNYSQTKKVTFLK